MATAGARAGSQPPTSSRNLFVRNATGLVRELSAFDAFNLVFSAVLIPIGITEVMSFTPQFWPHANMLVSFLLATPLVAACGLVYLYFTVIMPRSGGDYVWVSRTLNPFLGFFANLSLTFVFLTWISFNFTYMLSVVLPSVAYVAGWNAGWVTSPDKTEVLVISTILTAGLHPRDGPGRADGRAVHVRRVRDRLGGHHRLARRHGRQRQRALHQRLQRPLRQHRERRDRHSEPRRLQRGRRDRLGRHPVRDDLLLPGLHRLPVDRVLRRRDPQRPARPPPRRSLARCSSRRSATCSPPR